MSTSVRSQSIVITREPCLCRAKNKTNRNNTTLLFLLRTFFLEGCEAQCPNATRRITWFDLLLQSAGVNKAGGGSHTRRSTPHRSTQKIEWEGRHGHISTFFRFRVKDLGERHVSWFLPKWAQCDTKFEDKVPAQVTETTTTT